MPNVAGLTFKPQKLVFCFYKKQVIWKISTSRLPPSFFYANLSNILNHVGSVLHQPILSSIVIKEVLAESTMATSQEVAAEAAASSVDSPVAAHANPQAEPQVRADAEEKLASAVASLEVTDKDADKALPPHRSHDPDYNQKRTDPFQFGSRFLEEGDDPFEFNAWDHVETDDAYKEYSEQQYEMQRQSPVSDFDKRKLISQYTQTHTSRIMMIYITHSSSDFMMTTLYF